MNNTETIVWLCRDDDGQPNISLTEPYKNHGVWWGNDIHPSFLSLIPNGEKKKYKMTLEEV